ncbi:hypothetical protein CVT24_008372 [Panaeolus cyanescens]|uniref:Uncharacterized protein n=1 Tax=Panaeolus cyanescens TaxID=181874 RepID=A0A409VE15_9AGAR|nr:hypothetical protein CVT24_008372 [Panaeolus cyanescens]
MSQATTLVKDSDQTINDGQNAQAGPSHIPACAPKPARRKRQQQPTPQELSSLGIKVRDFAYESKLPPVKTVYRQPKQVQPSSQAESQGPKPLERTLTEPVIEPERQPGAYALADIGIADAGTQDGTPMVVDPPRSFAPKPLSRALQPTVMAVRTSTPAPQPIFMVPTSPAQPQGTLSAPLPPSSPDPFSRSQAGLHQTLSRHNSRQICAPKGRRTPLVRSPYKLRKRPLETIPSLAPPPKRPRTSRTQADSEPRLPIRRSKRTTTRGKGRGKK